LVVAVLSGAALPIILKRKRIDPALAGGVILTTITDVVGFFSFLGLASILYL
jgi:magnesium transporter